MTCAHCFWEHDRRGRANRIKIEEDDKYSVYAGMYDRCKEGEFTR